MPKNTAPLPDWELVLSSAARLQRILPDAVLVGGTASAIHAEHLFSRDAGHVLAELESRLEGARVDLVLSDMAPNLSGVAAVDQARSVHLCELALDFAVRHLKPEGQFLVKMFQGEGFMEYRKQMEAAFASVQVRKPKASRDRSAEVYVLGKGPRALQ